MSVAAPRKFGSEAVTEGIRVNAEPSFVPAHSDAERGRYIFAYKVRMTNEGNASATLRSRRWFIVDADGQQSRVVGPGVVGQHPILAPGESFEYASFCPLATPWGTMEGHFVFEREDGSTFEAQVARFYLASGG